MFDVWTDPDSVTLRVYQEPDGVTFIIFGTMRSGREYVVEMDDAARLDFVKKLCNPIEVELAPLPYDRSSNWSDPLGLDGGGGEH